MVYQRTEQQPRKQRGRPKGTTLTVAQNILIALNLVDYATRAQLARLLDMESSRTYLRQTLSDHTAAGLVLCLPGSAKSQPHVYTLTRKGREYASQLLGTPTTKRFRPSEERDKAHNPYFMQHTLAVSDVLIAARLLSQTTPGITLNRIYTERALRRKISVTLESTAHARTIYVEPDASLDFFIAETWKNPPETWQDFVHIEVYRNLPPAEWRFKQKVQGYVATVDTGRHEALFQTPALSIAVIAIAQTEQMAATLKRWTEEVLTDMERQAEGEWFFFCSVDPASASPEELYLSPVWEQAFSDVKTPLLVLE
jgi:Replication-relaxation